jgi:hypothetical protein
MCMSEVVLASSIPESGCPRNPTTSLLAQNCGKGCGRIADLPYFLDPLLDFRQPNRSINTIRLIMSFFGAEMD